MLTVDRLHPEVQLSYHSMRFPHFRGRLPLRAYALPGLGRRWAGRDEEDLGREDEERRGADLAAVGDWPDEGCLTPGGAGNSNASSGCTQSSLRPM